MAETCVRLARLKVGKKGHGLGPVQNHMSAGPLLGLSSYFSFFGGHGRPKSGNTLEARASQTQMKGGAMVFV